MPQKMIGRVGVEPGSQGTPSLSPNHSTTTSLASVFYLVRQFHTDSRILCHANMLFTFTFLNPKYFHAILK
ncbi:hypothetical protein Hanom_Chr08g00701291 [Helianthus anomalus]